ncbi:hypothetical protein T484DRAFT_1826190 [Baffinella frigidus]|nr:hypothetical protein T484DRAFT_1826190 [Cryptophyta sp. CCMP2293]
MRHAGTQNAPPLTPPPHLPPPPTLPSLQVEILRAGVQVEILRAGVQVPPNMRDTRWRIKPRAQYGEAKHLAKIKKEGLWDGGRNLPFPPVPDEHANLDEVAAAMCTEHALEDADAVRDMLHRLVLAGDEASGNEAENERQQGKIIRLVLAGDEATGNEAENERQQGKIIRYGDVIELSRPDASDVTHFSVRGHAI